MPKKQNPSKDTNDGEPRQEELTQEQLDEMSIEELEKLLPSEQPENKPELEPPDQEDESDAEEEEDKDSDEAEEQDDSESDKDQSEKSDTDDGEQHEISLDDRLAKLEEQLKEERLLRTQAEARQQRFEVLAGKHAGRAGYLEKQLRGRTASQVKTKDESADEDSLFFDDEDSAEQDQKDQSAGNTEYAQLDPETREELQEFRQTQAIRAMQDEAASFIEAHPDIETDTELQKEVKAALDELATPYREILFSGQTKMAKKVVRSLMAEAYSKVQYDRLQAARSEATTRKAEQVEDRKKQKKAATISGSGSKAGPRPSGAKSVNEMSEEELEARVRAIANDGSYATTARD